MLNFVSTRVVTLGENLALSPQGGYHAGEVAQLQIKKNGGKLPFEVFNTPEGLSNHFQTDLICCEGSIIFLVFYYLYLKFTGCGWYYVLNPLLLVQILL